MAARGWGLFSVYIYIENFKNLLVRNHFYNLAKMFFGDPLPRLSKPSWFVKNMAAQVCVCVCVCVGGGGGGGGEAYFPYISI